MTKDDLKQELKQKIIKYLNLIDSKPEDIKDDEPLFGSDLGLDSIDSIELVVLLEREYGLKIENPKEGRKVLVSVNVMADYILAKSSKI